MSCALEPAEIGGSVHRIGRRPNPWAWPDWAYAGPDGTFGNRYDDPLSEYRVLYASSQRLGCFLETLARFRPDPALAATEIAPDPRDAQHPTLAPGRVPPSWPARRLLGTGRLASRFADIGHSRSLAFLRSAMAARLVHFELDELDASAIRAGAPRRFTQELSRLVYACRDGDGERQFAGIRYLSRLGDELSNWAIYEPDQPLDQNSQPIAADDQDLRRCFELFELNWAD